MATTTIPKGHIEGALTALLATSKGNKFGAEARVQIVATKKALGLALQDFAEVKDGLIEQHGGEDPEDGKVKLLPGMEGWDEGIVEVEKLLNQDSPEIPVLPLALFGENEYGDELDVLIGLGVIANE